MPELPANCELREPWNTNITWRGQTCVTVIWHGPDGDSEYYGWYTLSGGEDWQQMSAEDIRAEQDANRDTMLQAALDAFYTEHPEQVA